MKNLKKTLSLLLAVCMMLGTFCIVSAEEEVTLPEMVFDLDITNFASTSTAGANGAVNAVADSTAAIFFQNKSGSGAVATLTKKAMTTATGGTTEYINYAKTGEWNHASQAYIIDSAWENEDTTFSFWITKNYTNTTSVPLAAYNLIYDVSGTATKKGVALWEISDMLWNNNNDMESTVTAKDGWNHVTIVNRKADEDGNKAIDLYMNGVFWESVTIAVPAGATLTENSLSFGADRHLSGVDALRKGNNDFGKVQAYTGALSAEQVAYLYESQQSDFVPLDVATATKLFDLDLTNFASTSTTGANGAINAGTSTTSDIKLWNWRYGTTNDRIYLTKKEMSNTAGGISEYINYSSKGATWTSSLQTTMSDLAWEEEDTTISFWMTPATESVTSERILASYNLAYTNESGTVTNKYINIWEIGSKNLKTANDGSTAVTAKDGFNHFVIVNKKADSSGNKSCDLYVNGAFYKTLTIEKPADTTLTNASLSFGYSPNASNTQARYVLDFGKVQVYKGLFAAADIKDLYDLQAPEMTALALADAPKLLDLNIDNFYPTTTEGSSGITNAGTSTTANLDIYSTAQIRVDKQSLMSADLTTAKPYIYMSHPFGNSISSGTALSQHFDISDTAWANQPVTISFWADLDRSMQQDSGQSYCWIATYNVDYTNADATTGNNETGLWQYGLDTDTNYYWGKGSWKNDIAMNSSREWAHVAFVVSNNRSVKMYVNGVDRGTVTLDIPEDAEITNATLRFGGGRANTYLPGDLSIADVKVYGALLTDSLIKEIYDAEKETYANAGEAKIRFYNADDTEIVKLNGITADGTTNITVKYTDTITPDCTIIAASYDSNLKFITAKKITTEEGSGSFEFPILEDTKTIKIFVWEDGVLSPIQKVTSIQYNDN